MLVENWIVTRLLAAEAVKALVSDRVYPVTVPQAKDLPAIAYSRTRTVRGYTMQGPDHQPKVSIRISALVKDRVGGREGYRLAKQIMEAMRPLFDGIRETPARPPVSAFFVARCIIVNEADAFQGPPEGSEDLIYTPFFDLEIDHKE